MEKKVYNQNQLEKIHFLQRLTRSFYVRRQFEHVRQEYLQTLSEIEGAPIVEEEDKPTPGNWKNVSPRTIESCGPLRVPVAPVAVGPTREELLLKRDEIAIELVWLEQAIQSRKDYLRLKSRYTNSVRS